MSTWAAGPDASSTTFGADDEWSEVWWCGGCLVDRTLSLELVAGRAIGMCEHCWTGQDCTLPTDVGVAWCDGCARESTFTVLCDAEVEGEPDPDWVYWACVICQAAPAGDVTT